ncbi:hypothetical protein MLD38_026283 [Melastoma candidum]|uniref:Uncharacterized protein n=1 Tax=Melastoma candidum TaxID=119954 RepID=A0ACB9NYJ5_9MYRT|nr:hypothetical protein MLD38_026283 [Melastoma candidum]
MKTSGLDPPSRSSIVLRGWLRPRRRLRRHRGSTVHLGNGRRGFCLGSRPLLRWTAMAGGSFQVLKRMVTEMYPWPTDACFWLSLPILRPQLFPLC